MCRHLISLCRVDFFPKLNCRVYTAIRILRVDSGSVMHYAVSLYSGTWIRDYLICCYDYYQNGHFFLMYLFLFDSSINVNNVYYIYFQTDWDGWILFTIHQDVPIYFAKNVNINDTILHYDLVHLNKGVFVEIRENAKWWIDFQDHAHSRILMDRSLNFLKKKLNNLEMLFN